MHSLGSISIAAEELAIHNIITILKKQPNERTSKEIAVISKFLEFSDLMRKFRINNREMTDLHQMFYHCSMNMKHEFFEKDKNIFQYGEKGDRFYIVLKGRIQVLKPIADLERLTALDYMKYIKSLYDKKEKPLLKMALEANKTTYPINNKDIPELDRIIFRLRYRKALITRASIEELKNIFKEHNTETEFLQKKDLNLDKLYQLKERDLSLFYQTELSSITSELNSNKYDNYKYAMEDSSKKILTIFQMNPFMVIETGQYFGDLALDDDRDRSATMRAIEDSHLGYLDSNVYKEHIAAQKKRFVLKEIMFLLDNFFLCHLKKENFEINHFPSFVYEEYVRGEILIKENQQIRYIYFIKEGEVEISCNKNILEIHKILKILNSMKVDYQHNYREIYQFHNQPKNFIDDLKRKKIYKLFIYGSNEVLAAEQFYFNLNSLYQAKVASDKLKVYKIEVREMQLILEDKYCLADLEKISKNKIVMLTNRFIEIKNVSLKFLDDKIAGRQSGVNNHDNMEKEIENKRRKSPVDKSSRKILTINYSVERIEKELTSIKPNSTRNEKFPNNASRTNLKNLKSIQNSPNNFELPIIETNTINKGDFSSIGKKELNLEKQQIQNLKSELKLFSSYSITNASNIPNFDLNILKNKKNVSLESGADYYMKTTKKYQLTKQKFSLNQNEQPKEYFLTEISSSNETNSNTKKSFKGDRLIKTNKQFKNYTRKFISDSNIMQIKENFLIENFGNLNNNKEINKFRVNTNESDYANDTLFTEEKNKENDKRKTLNEDSFSIKSILLKFNHNDKSDKTSVNTFLGKLKSNYFSKK